MQNEKVKHSTAIFIWGSRKTHRNDVVIFLFELQFMPLPPIAVNVTQDLSTLKLIYLIFDIDQHATCLAS